MKAPILFRTSAGVIHGEYKSWNEDGSVRNHFVVVNGAIRSLTKDERDALDNVSSVEENFLLKLKYGVPLISDARYGH